MRGGYGGTCGGLLVCESMHFVRNCLGNHKVLDKTSQDSDMSNVLIEV